MINDANSDKSTNSTDHSAAADNYDPHIIPAETAARKEREGDAYKKTPAELRQDSNPDAGEIDTTEGYTVDKEGLINNFAIEPEMYINEPGDLREEQDAEDAERRQKMKKANQTDETGKLTDQGDDRGKGVGLV